MLSIRELGAESMNYLKEFWYIQTLAVVVLGILSVILMGGILASQGLISLSSQTHAQLEFLHVIIQVESAKPGVPLKEIFMLSNVTSGTTALEALVVATDNNVTWEEHGGMGAFITGILGVDGDLSWSWLYYRYSSDDDWVLVPIGVSAFHIVDDFTILKFVFTPTS
jgi:hypothetical protein